MDTEHESPFRYAFDAVAASIGLLLLSPLLLLAVVAIIADSPGAAMIRQERVGKGGRRFRMVKLRTMVRDAEADGRAVWARPGDPRVTRVGRLLRHTHIDELPQLWNVIRGEMSLIGPRPERPELVEQLARTMPDYPARQVVRPGITGWAQVHLSYSASVANPDQKLALDLYYIRNRSLYLDACIWLRTLGIALGICRL